VEQIIKNININILGLIRLKVPNFKLASSLSLSLDNINYIEPDYNNIKLYYPDFAGLVDTDGREGKGREA
jgi:hypothetical protein